MDDYTPKCPSQQHLGHPVRKLGGAHARHATRLYESRILAVLDGRSTHHMSTRRGFTLLEVAIVVALMGIIGGYAAPRLFQARMRASSRSAAQAVLAHVTRTRDIASRRRIATRVILSGSTVRALGTIG